jgi:hypothetical protein
MHAALLVRMHLAIVFSFREFSKSNGILIPMLFRVTRLSGRGFLLQYIDIGRIYGPGYRSRSPGFDSRLPDFLRNSGSGTGSSQPREDN